MSGTRGYDNFDPYCTALIELGLGLVIRSLPRARDKIPFIKLCRSIRIISEAPLATSGVSTTVPMSAFFKVGASFTPSPVIPQICASSPKTSSQFHTYALGILLQIHRPSQSVHRLEGLQLMHPCLGRAMKRKDTCLFPFQVFGQSPSL
eukprot:TRINITY_DN2191_c0_g1_i5.p1 TRINITY_DN2191_c0_g1~~TRINITY_DN2191_c0_g1_i5.p1  ORF type:complete len:149 (-),score=4.18 TRINITY_DN2191_c0_g1_i5:841-1287(-)